MNTHDKEPRETPEKPAARPVRNAATLIVLRDGARGLEVLMLRRAEKANDQNSGASVFPGGVIDAHDRGLHQRTTGLDDAAASARLGVAEGGLDYYAAAIRECFEEAGLLFAADAHARRSRSTACRPNSSRPCATQPNRAPTHCSRCAMRTAGGSRPTGSPTSPTGSRRRACRAASTRASFWR
ncbi:NUDIX domain-containing protein [Variovorax sp. E3]|uniref:NUDIX domain-containing protein n=1 Tax=Variovorax sp. E3 TaxID=1914993 RepID=UPI0022B63E5C|nr:NUDIX domain-containing protein [Variovorax sp. E3]